ncbi:MAG: energy-coupling factor transporter transmembrane protein EcfT [Acidobacteria bacterium]|nr:energy-coupling factor transporter transmembrane protein EcfT [Acidobacteriota bacterium]
MSTKHAVVDVWSRGDSPLHRLDARVKILALLAFLLSMATLHPFPGAALAGFGAMALLGIVFSRLPFAALLLRACAVLPFTITFAAISAWNGDAGRAWGLLAKAFLSALAVLLLAGTTPMPRLLNAAHALRCPRILVLVVQFLHRYLFVLLEQAAHMRAASLCRGYRSSKRTVSETMEAAAGMLSVLFARSYERADAIHRSMMARGFRGEIPLLDQPALHGRDFVFLVTCIALAAGIRLWVTR